MLSISAIVHTKNAATTLPRALESLQFATEIIVIDMESTDETCKIARAQGAKVLSHQNVDYVEPARNFGIQQAQEKWVLILDADEEIPNSLREKIITLAQVENQVDGYYLPRKNIIFDAWISHTAWWPDYQLRFFKKGTVSWPDEIHAHPQVTGKFEYLEASPDNAILHHNYQSVEQFLSRLNRYTSVTVKSQKSTQTPQLTETELLRSFYNEFLSRLFAHQGIEDGTHGVGLSLLQGMYQAVINLKFWQQNHFKSSSAQPQETIEELRRFQRHINYWIATYQIEKKSGLAKKYWQLRRKLLI